MSVANKSRSCRLRWFAGLLILTFAGLAGTGLRNAGGQAPATNPEPAAAPTTWTVLFRSDDPAAWDSNAKDSKGEQIAIPVRFAPSTIHYLRLRRMDTGEAQILPVTRADLQNGRPPSAADVAFWWNGSAKEDWKGRHLGIVQAPRHKFPAPHGLIGIMTEGWDLYTGSGFGHKCAANDRQYYCWRGYEIPRTVFEIAVTEGPLTADEKRSLVNLVAQP
jgi:hypothetical protein